MEDNIKQTLSEMGVKADTVPAKEALNYAMPVLQKLYAEVQPNITTCSTNNVLYFNSTEQWEDNAFFMQLINTIQQKSTTMASLVSLRKNMLIGNGLEPVNPNDAAVLEFLNKPNSYGETLQEQWEKLCADYAYAEACALEVIYDGTGKITEIVHNDISTVRARANTANPNIPITDTYYLSRQWAYISNKNFRRYTVANYGLEIKAYNPEKWAVDGARQLLYIKKYNSGNNFYSIPSFVPCLSYAELEYQLANYHLGVVSKGFFPSVIVNLTGNPTDEEKSAFTTAFKNKYQGADKEKILFTWTTNSDEKPSIIPFVNTTENSSELFKTLNDLTIQRICSAFGATPDLAGLSMNVNSLNSDAGKLATAYEYFYVNSIRPMQKIMLQYINKIFKQKGLGEVTVVTPPLKLNDTTGQSAPTASQTADTAPITSVPTETPA